MANLSLKLVCDNEVLLIMRITRWANNSVMRITRWALPSTFKEAMQGYRFPFPFPVSAITYNRIINVWVKQLVEF